MPDREKIELSMYLKKVLGGGGGGGGGEMEHDNI